MSALALFRPVLILLPDMSVPTTSTIPILAQRGYDVGLSSGSTLASNLQLITSLSGTQTRSQLLRPC